MQYADAGLPIPYLEIDVGGYLLEMLYEAGPVKALPMGGVDAITWSDLYPYIQLATDGVEVWEARQIIDMSKAFAQGLNEGKNIFSIAPIDRE
jgi:hypothetical protein